MIKTAMLLAGAVLLLQQGVGTNDGGTVAVRGADDGLDSSRTPNFTGGITLRPEAGSYDEAPAWIREPTPARIGAVFPAQAIRTGQDGSVDMKCRLTVDGALTGCIIVRESPEGLGFGAAARALTPDLNVKPAMKAGRPIASDVSFNIRFTGPGATTIASRTGVDTLGAQRFLPSVAWTSAPTYEQVVAAYPAAARATQKGGRATLDCIFTAEGTLRDCGISNEEPVGLGFGEAAKSLATAFSAPATLANGASIEGAAVTIPVTFSERMLAAGPRATGRPAFAMMPANTDFGRAFPAQARQAAVLSGTASIECSIGAGGALTACTVASETPAGMGFGAAALSLAPKFQVNPWSAEGLPVVGGKIRVPMRYDLKAGA